MDGFASLELRCVEGMMKYIHEIESSISYAVSSLYGGLCNGTLQRCCQHGFSMLWRLLDFSFGLSFALSQEA